MTFPELPKSRSRTVRPLSSVALPSWLPPLFYLLLAVLFLWRSLFTGDVFLPAGLLAYIAPYGAHVHPAQIPPWNPLRWDGIAQFYPWRHFAAETLHQGTIPLWNPYQFCGTPFVANSQSAVFYPGNLLFYLLPTARAFSITALMHLTLCGWSTFLLLRRLGRSHLASLLGGTVYAYSAWQVAWLQLPTFLATSCWFPLLLRQIHSASRSRIRWQDCSSFFPAVTSLAAVIGMMLLAGHLQVAFYGLLAGSLWALALLIVRTRQRDPAWGIRLLAVYLSALVLGLMLALPQLLPTLELSRRSHRAGNPTASGYAAYTEYALQPAELVTLTLPDFYGNDFDPQNLYWGYYRKQIPDGPAVALRHNAAETAIYTGIVPLLLGGLALMRSRGRSERDWRALFFGALALLALLIALGTPVDALFYFGVPGFGQSGSPARALVLWALALAALASFGLDALRLRMPTRREGAALLIGIVFVLAIGLGLAANSLAQPLVGLNRLKAPLLGEALSRIGVDGLRLALMLLCGALLLLPGARRPLLTGSPYAMPALAPAALLLVLLDLFSAGILVNPTASPDQVYPTTPGIRFLRISVAHERIFPVNHFWSLTDPPPAVLPPNGAMVYGLRDVQGYDSLLTGRYKAFANQMALPNALGVRDASPPEVGNMVFLQDPNAASAPRMGAAFVLTLPPGSSHFVAQAAPPGSPLYSESDEMAIYRMPDALQRARLVASDGRPAGAVQWLQDDPTRIALSIDASAAGTLILADAFYPGWHAEVDRNPARLTPDETGVYRTVHITPGAHRVTFRYDPASFRLGLYLACLSCMVLAFALAACLRRPDQVTTRRGPAIP